MNRQYLGTCVKCPKRTTELRWVSLQKVYICSYHYQWWKRIKDYYHKEAVLEFWQAKKQLICDSRFCLFTTFNTEAMKEHNQEFHESLKENEQPNQ